MAASIDKKLNKRIIWAVIGTTVLWWLSMTPKWRSRRSKVKDVFTKWINEMKKELKRLDDEDNWEKTKKK